jgi:hypothetical protein
MAPSAYHRFDLGECDGPRQAGRNPLALVTVDISTMITMRLPFPDLSKWQAPAHSTTEQDGRRSGILAGDQPATVATPFQPLDPSIVSEAIPAFFIGRNRDGFWLARDARGNIGGMFLLESSALSFARRHSRPAGCATIFPSERFELDLENRGNPLIVHLVPLMRLAMRGRQRAMTFIGRLAEAIERRSKVF